MRVGEARGWELCADDVNSYHNPTARARATFFPLRLLVLSPPFSLLQTMVLLRERIILYFFTLIPSNVPIHITFLQIYWTFYNFLGK